MGIGVIALGVMVSSLLVFVLLGGPAVLMDRLRKRRREAVMHQIALTDALDGQFGPIVAPVVTRPLWGPWRVRIAVPFSRPVAIGKILAVAHEVLSTPDRMNPDGYQFILTPKPDSSRGEHESRASHSALGWPRDTRAAA